VVKLSQLKEALKGLSVNPNEIFEKISSHTELRVNPSEIRFGYGSQKWGSGGYSWHTTIFLGDPKEHKPVDVIREEDQFIYRVEYIYRVDLQKPLVLYTHEYDCIDSSGHRCFLCVLYIVNPNLKS